MLWKSIALCFALLVVFPGVGRAAPEPAPDDTYAWSCAENNCQDPPGVPSDPAFYQRLRNCESRKGDDSAPYDWRGDRYHGWYQFTLSSWAGAGGWGDPHAWSLAEQTWRVKVWASRTNEYGQWPICWSRAMRGR